ncbi:TetR/AcrR family transcriptional regulator [Nocardia tengchongensis]|uniref:TetR/AcrR family transcriptional regulator n=1 Tax=Nocardia tengchongensis TaxID=2055889 RepID=UPI0036C4CCBA
MDQPEQQPSAPRKRTGGRSARVRQSILTATVAQIAEHGLEGLTISEVADRAGVAETTIYRRWGTRTALVADAVADLAAEANPVPDTGTLRGDLQQLADQITHLISQPGIARLLGSALALSVDADVDAARRHFWNDRFDRTSQVITRAIDRGELALDTDPREVMETLAAPLYFRLLVSDRPLDAPFITRCINHTMALYSRAE